MGVVLLEVQSKSKPGKYYKVQKGADGVIYCDCWQWKRNRTCSHINLYLNGNDPSATNIRISPPPIQPTSRADELGQAVADEIARLSNK